MKEYIDKETLRGVVCNLRLGKHLNKDAALNLMDRAIDNLPAADVVEVVRCKDCKHKRHLQGATDEANVCGLGWGLSGLISEEDFCSYGERRVDHAD